MKKNNIKKAIALLAIALVIFISGCVSNRCSGMKYHNQDVKRGIAH